MNCPNCCHELKHVTAKSHYGAVIKLNQCSNCGGIWFDDWELFSLDDEEAKNLEEIDIKKLSAVCHIYSLEKQCPVCNLPLEKLKDSNIPGEINIESCQKCGGFWLNRGETKEYKEYQKAKITAKDAKEYSDRDKKFYESMRKLLEMQSSNFETLGRVGRFLSTPLDRDTLMPLKSAMGEDSSSAKAAGDIAGLAIEILTIILRALIGGWRR